MIECLLYANEMTSDWVPLDSFRVGAGHQKDQGRIRDWNFDPLPYLPSLRLLGGERHWKLITRGQGFHESCLHNETFIRPSRQQDLEGLWVREHTQRVRKGVQPNSTGTEAPTLGTFLALSLCTLHLAVHLFSF